MNAVLEEMKESITKDHIIISIAAGIKIETIQSFLGQDVPVIRVMPNTPALIQKGVSFASAGETVTPAYMNIALEIIKAVGIVFIVDEVMMDAVTAVSGSGPGFVFKLMECFVEATEKQGFDKDTSKKMVIQTFLGASLLAESSELSLSGLRKMVTSPGGTTEAGLKFLDTNRINEIIDGTIKTAKDRSIELGKK
jgi:pyrroline-5-carboxylate reductase